MKFVQNARTPRRVKTTSVLVWFRSTNLFCFEVKQKCYSLVIPEDGYKQIRGNVGVFTH